MSLTAEAQTEVSGDSPRSPRLCDEFLAYSAN